MPSSLAKDSRPSACRTNHLPSIENPRAHPLNPDARRVDRSGNDGDTMPCFPGSFVSAVPLQALRVIRQKEWRSMSDRLDLELEIRDQLQRVGTAPLSSQLLKRGLRNVFIARVGPVNPLHARMVAPAYTLREGHQGTSFPVQRASAGTASPLEMLALPERPRQMRQWRIDPQGCPQKLWITPTGSARAQSRSVALSRAQLRSVALNPPLSCRQNSRVQFARLSGRSSAPIAY